MKKQFTADFAKRFKKAYTYKMGGTQTIVLPNGQEFYYDDREYYSGRGSKYNNSIRHDNIGKVEVTSKNVRAALTADRDRDRAIKAMEVERKAKAARIEAAKAAGRYDVITYDHGTFVELSENEIRSRSFDADRLAATLDISVHDAELLNSEGKTYVFAKTSAGKVLELYHSDLSCNYLNISVSEATPERIAEFNHSEWAAAPFAGLVGMTNNSNHFVC